MKQEHQMYDVVMTMEATAIIGSFFILPSIWIYATETHC